MAKKKNLVASFSLGPHKIEVLGCPDMVKRVETDTESLPVYGDTDPISNTITLYEDYYLAPKSRQHQILWHEITHVLLHTVLWERWGDEDLAWSMSSAISQIITTWKE